MIAGDGWSNGQSWCYKSISKQLRADMCEIAQKLGYGITMGGDTVNIRKIQIEPTINHKPHCIQYNGTVYCCSLPNELIYVMVNGKAFWSHNSYRPQKIIESYQGGEKPAVLLIGHYHKISYNIIRNVHTFQAGCVTDQTVFLRKKSIECMVGGWIIEVEQDTGHGGVKRIKQEARTFFDRAYYQGWEPS